MKLGIMQKRHLNCLNNIWHPSCISLKNIDHIHGIIFFMLWLWTKIMRWGIIVEFKGYHWLISLFKQLYHSITITSPDLGYNLNIHEIQILGHLYKPLRRLSTCRKRFSIIETQDEDQSELLGRITYKIKNSCLVWKLMKRMEIR